MHYRRASRRCCATVLAASALVPQFARATDYVWDGAIGNDWFDQRFDTDDNGQQQLVETNWSPLGIPQTADDNVTLAAAANLTQSVTINSLSLPAAGSSLTISGNDTATDVGLFVNTSLTNSGTITLDATGNDPHLSALYFGGTLTNNGTINLSASGPGGERDLYGSIVNANTINDAGQATYLYGNIANTGLYTRQSGGTTHFTGNIFTQQTGQLIIDPAATFVVNGGDFKYTGGSISGTVDLYYGVYPQTTDIYFPTLEIPIADGHNTTFNFDITGSLTTDLPANTNLNVIASDAGIYNEHYENYNTILNVPQAFTNNGIITLEALDEAYTSTLTVGGGSGTLTNNGRIIFSGAGPGGIRQITGNIVNNNLISDAGKTTSLVGNVTNNGLYERETGGTTTVEVGYTFTQQSGQLYFDLGTATNTMGTFNVIGSTFIYAGGTIDNGPVNLKTGVYPQTTDAVQPHLRTPIGDGQNAVFNLYGTGNLDTDFPYNTTLNVIAAGNTGNVYLYVPDSFNNFGQINLDGADAGHVNVFETAGTLSNVGTIDLNAGAPGSACQFSGNVFNFSNIHDGGKTTFIAGDVTNYGLYERLSGGTTQVGVGCTFTQQSGQLYIDNGGKFSVFGGTFIYSGGAVVGAVNLYQDVYPASTSISAPQLSTPIADGQNAIFNFYSSGNLNTDLPPHTTVNVVASGADAINLFVNDGTVNHGIITLSAQNGAYQSGIYSPGTITNAADGVINSSDDNNVGGARVISSSIINNGYIAVHSSLDVFGSLRNEGSLYVSTAFVAIDNGQTLTLHGGNFTLSLGGELSIGLGGSLSFVDGGQYIYEGGSLDIYGTFEVPNQPALLAGDTILVSGNGANYSVDSGGILIAAGSIVSQGAGNIVSQGAGNIVSQGAGNIVSQGAGNVVSHDGGSIVAQDGGHIVSQGAGNLVAVNGQNGSGFAPASQTLRPAGSNIIADDGTITLSAGNAMADGNGIVKNGGLLTGNGTFTATAFDVDATSTVIATGGTLHLLGAINPYVSGTLTTGHWQVETNSTLDTPDIGDITVNQASVTLDGIGSVWNNVNNLTNNQGSFTITHGRNFLASTAFSNSGTLTVGPSSTFEAAAPLTNTGTIDVAGGTLQLDQGLNGSSIIAQLRLGFANGNWNGPGIISSLAASHLGTAIGYGSSGSASKLQYTWLGDANLDGIVNASDLNLISPTGNSWGTGDFNYDGNVNADDYALFALGSAASGGANISTTLPEPQGVMLALFSISLIHRRGRTSRAANHPS